MDIVDVIHHLEVLLAMVDQAVYFITLIMDIVMDLQVLLAILAVKDLPVVVDQIQVRLVTGQE
jgi:hypothetical protein